MSGSLRKLEAVLYLPVVRSELAVLHLAAVAAVHADMAGMHANCCVCVCVCVHQVCNMLVSPYTACLHNWDEAALGDRMKQLQAAAVQSGNDHRVGTDGDQQQQDGQLVILLPQDQCNLHKLQQQEQQYHDAHGPACSPAPDGEMRKGVQVLHTAAYTQIQAVASGLHNNVPRRRIATCKLFYPRHRPA